MYRRAEATYLPFITANMEMLLNYIVISLECGWCKCCCCSTVIVTEKTNILLRYLHQQWDRKVKPTTLGWIFTRQQLSSARLLYIYFFLLFPVRMQPKSESRIKPRGITLHLHGKYPEQTVGKWTRILRLSVLSVHTQQRLITASKNAQRTQASAKQLMPPFIVSDAQNCNQNITKTVFS